MNRSIVWFFIYFTHVFGEPGFDNVPALSLFSFRYSHELHRQYHIDNGMEFVKKQLSKTSNVNTNIPKNTVLFLGDGMSIPTLVATRMYVGGEEKSLSFETFPYVALSKTYCVDKQVADSACTATAYLSGVKNNYGTIGVNANVPRTDCTAGTEKSFHTESIAQWAINAGKSIGLVTTTRVTHASPAGVYAHIAERNWESNTKVRNSNCNDELIDDIAEQLVHGPVGKELKVIFGGGRFNFINETKRDEQGTFGNRTDGKDLIKEWLDQKNGDENRTYVWNKHDLLSIKPEANTKVLGLFAADHCEYNYKIDGISDTAPTLTEMTMKAIEILSINPKGFFLFVEGGRIDMALHENHAHIALEETAEFSRAVELSTKMLNFNESLVVVTSDHSHTLTIGGYPDRGSNIFGVASRGDDVNIPYLKLNFANGPAYKDEDLTYNQRHDRTNDETINNFSYLSPSTLPLEDETHAGDDVAIFAIGPHSHLFTGVMEQHNIPHFMAYASCIGNGLTHCNKS